MSNDQRNDYLSRIEAVMVYNFPCCINCAYWVSQLDQCSKVDKTPPPVVIARGCEEWQADIPF